MAKSISILGSTGSIGTQTLDVARNLNIKVKGLAAKSNVKLLISQVDEFHPEAVSIDDEEKLPELKKQLEGQGIEIFSGKEGLVKIATLESIDTVVVSVVGIAGLLPTIEAIKCGKHIALANKETLVAGGRLVMHEVQKNNVNIYPIDSEHSAIFQCMRGNKTDQVARIILTASGGPFRGKTAAELKEVTVEQALKHPNWNMGKKVTIDAATLMNKGFEVIEAKWLFGLEIEKIDVLLHPQSIIHSMIEYCDGSVIAQIGAPDMRIPIQYALNYPERVKNNFEKIDFKKSNCLNFENPDTDSFPCLKLAYESIKIGGTMPATINAVNEEAVKMFLEKKIGFTDIPKMIDYAMKNHNMKNDPEIDDILIADFEARKNSVKWIQNKNMR